LVVTAGQIARDIHVFVRYMMPNMMTERFELSEEISFIIDSFIAALTPSMQRQLRAA